MQQTVSYKKIKRALDALSNKIYIRSDIYDRLLSMASRDPALASVLVNRVDATWKLDLRIQEANQQGNAALVWDTWSGRGIGKSWLNYLICYRILTSRDVEEWKNRIVFKIGKEIINTASRWTEGIKFMPNP